MARNGTVALLTFPFPATNGQIYPVNPPAGINIYQWSSPEQTWRLLGVATGVAAGTYGDANNVGQFTVDATGKITFAQNVPIVAAPWTMKGQLVVGTGAQTQATLDPGVDTSILVVDSTTTTGLTWSDSSQEAALLPAGPSATRPASPVLGQIRYNYDQNQYEGYQGAAPEWQLFSTMPTGGVVPAASPEKIFYLNDQTIFEDYTVPVGSNAMTAGPITINAGVTVTVSAGSSWAIV